MNNEPKWERLSHALEVLRTAEGWLTRTAFYDGSSRTNHVLFVPDKDHIGFGPDVEPLDDDALGFNTQGYGDDIPF